MRTPTVGSCTCTPSRSAASRMPCSGVRRFFSTSTASARSGDTYSTRVPPSDTAASCDMSRSMAHKNAASVLPVPVGEHTSVWSPAAMAGQPSVWGAVGAAKADVNSSGHRPGSARRTQRAGRPPRHHRTDRLRHPPLTPAYELSSDPPARFPGWMGMSTLRRHNPRRTNPTSVGATVGHGEASMQRWSDYTQMDIGYPSSSTSPSPRSSASKRTPTRCAGQSMQRQRHQRVRTIATRSAHRGASSLDRRAAPPGQAALDDRPVLSGQTVAPVSPKLYIARHT